jgi:regulator of replication initiation timing
MNDSNMTKADWKRAHFHLTETVRALELQLETEKAAVKNYMEENISLRNENGTLLRARNIAETKLEDMTKAKESSEKRYAAAAGDLNTLAQRNTLLDTRVNTLRTALKHTSTFIGSLDMFLQDSLK